MADVRVAIGAAPAAPERYDLANEQSFRAMVSDMAAQIDTALQQLKTAARDGVVLTTGDQTIAGTKTFTGNISVNGGALATAGTATPRLDLRAGSAGAQIRLNAESDDLRWIIILADDDDDGDNDGGDLTFDARNDTSGDIGNALVLRRVSLNAEVGGNLIVNKGWINLHSTTSGAHCRVSFHNQNTRRWNLLMLQSTFDNSLNFLCYDNDGNQDKYVLTMDRLLYNVSIGDGSLAPNYQSMQGGLRLGNRYAAPTGNPSSGGFLYAESGALKWRGSSGTVTTIAPA